MSQATGRILTSLRNAAASPTSEQELVDMAGRLWTERGDWLVVKLDRVTNDFDRQHLINIGGKQYGRRARRR